MNYTTRPVHISLINVGDTIEVSGNLYTVGRDDLKSTFMGLTLRGDSYRLGTVPVLRVEVSA
jgi:hypothetical protein